MIAPQRREDFTHAATTSTRPRPCVRHSALCSVGINRRRAVGAAIGVQQHLVIGALDGAIARRRNRCEGCGDRGRPRPARAGGPAGPAGPRSPGGPISALHLGRPVKARCTGTLGDRITIRTKVAMNPTSPIALNTPSIHTSGRDHGRSAEAPGRSAGRCSLLGSRCACCSSGLWLRRLGRLDRTAGVLPGAEAAADMSDRLQPHVLRRLRRQRRAQAAGAEEHEALVLARTSACGRGSPDRSRTPACRAGNGMRPAPCRRAAARAGRGCPPARRRRGRAA